MKYLLSILMIGWLAGACHQKSLLDVDENNIRLQKQIEKTGLEENRQLVAEYAKYVAYAKTCKTKYDVSIYIDTALPIMRKAHIKLFGSEANWKGHIEWLRTHEQKIVGYSEQGSPIIDRTEKSPYEKSVSPN